MSYELRKELKSLARVRSPSGKIHLKVPKEDITVCNNYILDTWDRLGRSSEPCTCGGCAQGKLPSERPKERDWWGPILDDKFKIFGGLPFDQDDLEEIKRRYSLTEWDLPKYVLFIEVAQDAGLEVSLYNAQKTVSKYITVRWKSFEYKVRFSNHAPNKYREEKGDCDFFVGVANYSIATWEDAWRATLDFFISKGFVPKHGG